jgi:anti-sigma regulatory factor (Ser/Thr protein kinase)
VTARRTPLELRRRGVVAAGLGTQCEDARLQAAARLRVTQHVRLSRLRLRLSASPEEVPFARAAITRLCEHLGIQDEQAQNIRLAVTEACSNCVLHAYDESTAEGTYVLAERVDRGALRVSVCDSGVGVHQAHANVHPGLGYGLHLIKTLADSTEISSPRPGGGTRLVMRFAIGA